LYDYAEALHTPFHCVGYSLGGRVAQKIAHHPACLSLTLISSQTLFTPEEKIEKMNQEALIQARLKKLALSDFFDQWYQAPLFSTLRRNKRLYERTLNRRLKQDPAALILGLQKLSVENLFSPLPRCPILGLYGRFDAKYQNLYTKLPEAIQVVSVEQAGHALHLENPRRCLELIEKFIGT